jgi:hypothetical protein
MRLVVIVFCIDTCDTTKLLLNTANSNMKRKFNFPTEAENRLIVADLVDMVVVAPVISINRSCEETLKRRFD